MAKWARGSLSVEIYCDSYNQVTHTSGGTGTDALTASYQLRYYSKYDYVLGYIYKVNGEENNSGWLTNPDTVDLSGYHGMYLCNQSAKISAPIFSWWLASPNAATTVSMCYVNGGGANLASIGVSNACPVCPAVSLKSGVQLEIVDE